MVAGSCSDDVDDGNTDNTFTDTAAAGGAGEAAGVSAIKA